MNDKIIKGFTVFIGKSPKKWEGSVSLKSQYKGLSEYVSSSKDSLTEVVGEIFERYGSDRILELNIERVNGGGLENEINS